MSIHDRDRFLKQLSINYCLSRHMLPYLEVLVPSVSELTDNIEVVTDLDVVGLHGAYDSSIRRVFFDCKNTSKISPINRVFWASGVLSYTGCDEAVVLLKSKATLNHRVSALKLNVDLHDESSFRNL
jgi:hypothetical protein